MVNSGVVVRPRSRSICARWVRTSCIASGGTRSSTTATEAPRSDAPSSRSHGTASAYRAAVVTNNHRSAAASSWAASSRLAVTTESMSGASSSASPGGSASLAASRTAVMRRSSPRSGSGSSPVTRTSEASTRSPSKAAASSGWCTSTGERVVGRSTPLRLTVAPSTELTSVDLPAPVDPPTTASSGASSERSRGST